MKKNINNIYSHILFIGIFCFFYIFYTQIHPLIPYNSDDWTFMSANRIALPNINAWNPSRILPEILMPLFSNIAAYVVFPLSHDYIGAQNIVHTCVVSLFITFYVYSFYHLIRKRFEVTHKHSIVYSLLFLMLHFLVFRNAETFNVHLFYSDDLTCHYFYLIPNIINAILVMSLLENNWFQSNNFSSLKKGIIIFILYLAICSNLYSSNIFVIFVGCQLLLELVISQDYKKRIKYFFKNNSYPVIIILFWLFVNVLELLGPRSAYLAQQANSSDFISLVDTSIKTFFSVSLNKLFIAYLCFMITFIGYRFVKEKKLPIYIYILFFSILVSFLYIIIVSAKANPTYSSRADILFAVYFPIILLIVLSFIEFQRQYSIVMKILPILLLITFSQINRTSPTFRDLRINSNINGDYTIKTLKNVDNIMINQIVNADINNANDSLFVVVPHVSDDEKNWPYLLIYNNGYNSITKTLYKHGLIQKIRPGKFVVGDDLSKY